MRAENIPKRHANTKRQNKVKKQKNMRPEKYKGRDYHQIMAKLYQKEDDHYYAPIHVPAPVSVPADMSERAVSPKSFQEVGALLQLEGFDVKTASQKAYRAVALLRSTDRVLQYLQKWGMPQTQALGSLLKTLPNVAGKKIDLKTWGDAVLQCGPRMAAHLSHDIVLDQPKRRYPHCSYSVIETATASHRVAHKARPYMNAFKTAQSNTHQKYEQDRWVDLKQGFPLKP